MKIKTFKFEICNWSSHCPKTDKTKTEYNEAQAQLTSPEQIDKTINEFCKGKNVQNININTVDAKYHYGGRGNTIEMIYTIIYTDNK